MYTTINYPLAKPPVNLEDVVNFSKCSRTTRIPSEQTIQKYLVQFGVSDFDEEQDLCQINFLDHVCHPELQEK